VNESSALQLAWNWMLGQLGVAFFEFPLYFLPVVVAVVLVTGVFFSILDVAVYHKMSARAAWTLGLRVMANYVGSATRPERQVSPICTRSAKRCTDIAVLCSPGCTSDDHRRVSHVLVASTGTRQQIRLQVRALHAP
jgi:hypothetical protein